MVLTDAESLCAFARFCDPNGKVWRQVSRTDDPKVRAMFLRQVNDCPSGRLVAWDKATRSADRARLAGFNRIDSRIPQKTAADRSGCAAASP